MIMAPWSAEAASAHPAAIWTARVRRVLAAAVKYATNHVVAHVPSYTFRHAWYRNILGWYVGPAASILMDQFIQIDGIRTSGKRVSIGAGTVIERGCLLNTGGGLLIGERVRISAGVWLVSSPRDADDPGFSATQRPVVIDDDVWIGARATVLGGVTIGEGAVVTAGAVVTSDVEPFAVVAGVPAQVVKTRQPPVMARAGNRRALFE